MRRADGLVPSPAPLSSALPSNPGTQVSAENFHGAPYQERVIELRNGPYLDFPAVIGIETLALCNAACNFCPYPALDRKGEAMPDRLIAKILDDIEDIKHRPPFKVVLARVNEPFLDSRIWDITAEIERRFPEALHMLFSNGTAFNQANLLRLAKLSKVDFLNLSVNDHRPREYEETMRLPFARTLSRLDALHEMKTGGGLGFPVFVSRVGDGSSADAAFLEWVASRYPAFNGLVTMRGDWMGAVQSSIEPAPDVSCRQWFEVHFLANGKEAYCCIDSDGRFGVGNAQSRHVIHEIYNHPEKRILREELPSRRRVPVCSGCPMLT